MSRISRTQLYMDMASLIAQRTTCLRRAVGCVLVNARGHVLSTGYNGVAAGQKHCNETETWTVKHVVPPDEIVVSHPHACTGATSPSGTNLDACQAIHAEQNALLQCQDVYEIDTCYCTTSPCMTCTKLLLNTSCKVIIYREEYPATEARDFWVKSGRTWLQYLGNKP
jgi:dCMP deaminase